MPAPIPTSQPLSPPAAGGPFGDATVRKLIAGSVGNVFRVMLSQETLPVEGTDDPEAAAGIGKPVVVPHDRIVGSIGFNGDATGSVFLHFELPFARACTRHLLGMSEEELAEAGNECLNDAIAEITNMTAGGFKNGLCDLGYPCLLTLPSILRGSSFYVAPVSFAARHVAHFDCGGHRVTAEIFIKSADRDTP